mgnify:CR=1 FL=1
MKKSSDERGTKNMKRKFFQSKFDIRIYECDIKGRLHPLSLFNFMQELASTHADRLGFSVQQLMQKQMTWVLSRLHLKILKKVYWKENIIGRTWPSERVGKYALRDFEFYNEKKELIATATSSWMVIDLEKRRPLKLDDLFTSDFIRQQRALPDDFPPLPQVTHNQYEKEFMVGFTDLDMNRHVNHVRYIVWALESLPEEILFKYFPMEVEVSYRKEVFLGDHIISKIQPWQEEQNILYYQQLFLKKSGEEIARLRTRWM